MRIQHLMVIPHSFLSLLITETLGRSFQVGSNDPFPHSIKQDFILDVYAALALMSVQWESCVHLSLGAALLGICSCRGLSLWRRQKSKEHPRLLAGIAANLLGSHFWSVPLSLSKGKSSPEFSAGHAQRVTVTLAWLCCQNPCEQFMLTFCSHLLSAVLAQKTFSPKGWCSFSKWFVCKRFLLTCLFNLLQLFFLVDSPQCNFVPSTGLNIGCFLGVKPQLNLIFTNYELPWFLASYKHKNVRKNRLCGFSLIYENVQKSGHLNRSCL